MRTRTPTTVQQPFFPGTEDATLLIQRITDEAVPGAVLDQPTEPVPRVTAHATDRTAGVVRAGALMAAATVVSRVTGLLAKVVIAAIIGGQLVNSAYTLANTLPNIVFELLIGGVLTSVAIPLLTRAQREDADGGLAYTQRLLSLASVGLLLATGIAVACAPLLTRLYLPGGSCGRAQDPVQAAQLSHLATQFALLLLPQIFFYGLAALFGAILNTKERFAANAWAPVCNNLVVIGVAAALFVVNGEHGLDPNRIAGDDLLVLGIGTTAGIVIQSVVMVPSLLRSGFRWKWRFGFDRRFRDAGRLLAWATLYVLISQAGVVVTTRLAAGADCESGIFRFQTASLIFQMPYGILGVAVLTAIMPRMSRHAAAGQMETVKDDMSLANRLSAVGLLPVSAALLVLGAPITVLLFRYGRMTASEASSIGTTLAFLGLGLLPLAVTLVQMRVFYAVKDGRTPTVINAVMVAVRIGLMELAHLVFADVITGLAAATAVSYLVGALVGEIWLRARFGPMGTTRMLVTVAKMGACAAAGGLAAYLVVRATVGLHPVHLVGALLTCLVGGGVGLVVIGGLALLLRVRELDPVRRRLLGRRELSPAVASPAPSRASFPGAPDPGRAPARPPTGGTPPGAVGGSGPAPAPRTASGTMPAFPGAHRRPPTEFREQVTQRVSSPPPEATVNIGGGGTPSAPATGAQRAVLAPGMTVGGRYRLVSLVGTDTAGNRFWRAKDTVLPRDMAVTLLPNTKAASATVARTLRVGRLHHIGLPQTLDVGTEQGESYVVGQWVDGATLTDLLSGGPLEPDVATSITAKLAEAVAEAHRNGIALGAINPSLVRVNFDGQVRLSHVIAHGNATPEQDIRAVGGLLYLMLTGTWPLADEAGRDSGDGATVLLPARNRPDAPTAPAAGASGLTPAPTRLGREVPADEVRANVPQALAALAERALHPDDPDGIHAVGAIAALLRRPEVAPGPTAPVEPEPDKPVRSAAERRLMKERRIKLSVAAAMLTIFSVLIVIVVASVSKQVMGGLVDTAPAGPVSGFSQPAAGTTPSASARVSPSAARSSAPATSSAASSSATAVVPPVSSAVAPSSAAPSVQAAPVKIVNATVYDPQGDGNKDYTGRVGRAFDGNPSSSWSTFVYNQQFPTVKQGVGLTLELDHPVVATSVQITSDTPNTRVEVRTATGNDVALGTTQTLGSGLITGTQPLTVNLTAEQPSKYLIVWVTQLAPKDNKFQSDLSEIVVNGR